MNIYALSREVVRFSSFEGGYHSGRGSHQALMAFLLFLV